MQLFGAGGVCWASALGNVTRVAAIRTIDFPMALRSTNSPPEAYPRPASLIHCKIILLTMFIDEATIRVKAGDCHET
jgi:hypothetical protein